MIWCCFCATKRIHSGTPSMKWSFCKTVYRSTPIHYVDNFYSHFIVKRVPCSDVIDFFLYTRIMSIICEVNYVFGHKGVVLHNFIDKRALLTSCCRIWIDKYTYNKILRLNGIFKFSCKQFKLPTKLKSIALDQPLPLSIL